MRIVWFSAAISIMMAIDISPASAQADAENGKEAFKVCRACHQVGEGAKNGIGPNLNGIIGRKAGTISGFNYSEQNRKAGEKGLIWTDESMADYLKNPAQFMPGNKMVFAGVKDEADRR